ncbi:MAG: transcription-repair coupling factor [Bacteroidales bacterium]|nr:transcription-repair coupling factor [Bacteroidales bacterium]
MEEFGKITSISVSAAAVSLANSVLRFDAPSLNIVVLDTKKQAIFFSSDLDTFFDDKCVFYLPQVEGDHSVQSIKDATAKVQRTSALAAIENFEGNKTPGNISKVLKEPSLVITPLLLDKERNSSKGHKIIVTYQDALKEKVLKTKTVRQNTIILKKGEKISHDFLKEYLFNFNFKKVDFVSEPGEFALRGSIIDIFSFNDNNPYRIDFFGDEIDEIALFDNNSQRTTESRDQVEIYPNIYQNFEESDYVDFEEIIPECAIRWPQNLNCDLIPQPTFNKNFEILYKDLFEKENAGYKVTILCENLNQRVRLKQILEKLGGEVHPEFLSVNFHEGYIDKIDKVCYYTDHQIFERYHKVKVRKEVSRSERLTIDDLTAFRIGDYVVHINHGVGQFGGLVKTNINGKMQEAVKLIYKDGDVIFVSIHGIHRISRYKSREGEAPKIYRLGSKAWENLKQNTKKKVKDIAADLIKLYAERMSVDGYAYSPDNYLQQELESSFIYEETADQQKAIDSVREDMESKHPMDRLVCGDVGFGKTEVAIRAAFKAVCDSRQVAVLVPTTILALQHYQTFSSRLDGFPVKIEYISRLKTAKEIKEIQENLKSGKTDIVIGTHRILNKSMKFKDLGLLIIDEEQKFGVGAKEKLRQLRQNIDTLTLTATPIPRTLQFSLLGARDLSIINTPPPNRLPVHTEIIDFKEDLIAEIINSEVERGGQVYFVHNRVEDILAIEGILHRICPKIRTIVAHGQTEPEELENRILNFIDGDYDVLLSTTIIENGIDIPNANTIIINNAQNFGLSDLHQLRGRVGRSNIKAYCYLIVPPFKTLTDEAKRRLNAIETFSDLGSGFNIAMQDLDIRGAGNLLGAEQSGFIADMGFETYQKILAEAMEEMRCNPEYMIESDYEEDKPDREYISDCTIETDIEALIPDKYLNMTSEKIRLYRELDGMKDEREIAGFINEMTDRYGPIPPQMNELINIVRLRHEAVKLAIDRIVLKKGEMYCYFTSNQNNPFFKSALFGNILKFVQYKKNLNISQTGEKLHIKTTRVNTIQKALELLREMLPLQLRQN